MNARRAVPRGWLILALLAALVLVPPTTQGVSASASARTIAVIGDSITARYNDNAGDAKQGWWSIVGRHYDRHVITFAESGSGFQRRGNGCSGARFADRLSALARHRPHIVLVEGGRNDWASCAGAGLTLSDSAQVRAATDRFLQRLRAALPRDAVVFVLGPPWGSVDASQRDRVTAIIKASAQRAQMHFIDTSKIFDGARTLDGTHPNRAGSQALARRVIAVIGPSLP